MKNNFRYLYLLVALLLAMGSCTEEPVDIFEDSRIEDYGNYSSRTLISTGSMSLR